MNPSFRKIKARSNLGPQDCAVIYDDGTVMDADGEQLGNIFDEV